MHLLVRACGSLESPLFLDEFREEMNRTDLLSVPSTVFRVGPQRGQPVLRDVHSACSPPGRQQFLSFLREHLQII